MSGVQQAVQALEAGASVGFAKTQYIGVATSGTV